jgi:hypothetical protein
MENKGLKNIIIDIADSVSENTETALDYLSKSNVNFEGYLKKGLKELNTKKKSNSTIKLTKSQTFFRRLVLAAEIVNSCYNERTFGSVKFQKLVYLCEHASRMNFSTSYIKQAAGPFDNKFMHTVKTQFNSQKWFKMERVKEGKYNKVKFYPLENVEKYKPYYQTYFGETDKNIQYIINTFHKSYTNDVELVATIFACWDEILNENAIFSNELIIRKVYDWSREKKKFSEESIVDKIGWMRTKGITPSDEIG